MWRFELDQEVGRHDNRLEALSRGWLMGRYALLLGVWLLASCEATDIALPNSMDVGVGGQEGDAGAAGGGAEGQGGSAGEGGADGGAGSQADLARPMTSSPH